MRARSQGERATPDVAGSDVHAIEGDAKLPEVSPKFSRDTGWRRLSVHFGAGGVPSTQL